LAKSFTHELLAERTDDDEGIPLIAPESAGRHGPVPELAHAADARDEARLLVAALTDEHDRGRAWQDMAVIHRHQWQGDGLSRVLADAGIPCSLAKGNGKHALFAGGDTVKLVTMHSSKGLEFPRVIIPDLGAMPRAGEDENEEARLLYVAMTRATEQLLLLHHTESAFTRRIRASINDIQRQLAGEPDVRVSVL
jgi:superfamily I DNA/RNA helicase